VGLVDQKSGVVGGRDRSQSGEWGYVSIHAEKRLRHEKTTARPGTEPAQVFLGDIEIKVRIDRELGAGKATSVNNTGVNGPIDDDEIRRAGKRGDDAEIGVVAAWKEESPR
jgi:hypothetical protein